MASPAHGAAEVPATAPRTVVPSSTLPAWVFRATDFLIEPHPSRGGMLGLTYQARRVPDCKPLFAVKKLHDPFSDDELSLWIEEVGFQSQLPPDEHLLPMRGMMFYPDQSHVSLLLEWCHGSSLYHHMQQSSDFQKRLNLSVQCAQAIDALHRHGLSHGSISPPNFLFDSSDTIKLGQSMRLLRLGCLVMALTRVLLSCVALSL
jgi:serine/threonine protein kinase